MKKIFVSIICAIFLLIISYKANFISDFISKKITESPNLIIKDKNKYYKDDKYLFVQNTNNFVPYSYNDLLNIIYTSINSGWDTFTFYCPSEYTSCLKDIENISKDDITLTHINNYVHPYNSFAVIKASYDYYGKITLNIIKDYTEKEINLI